MPLGSLPTALEIWAEFAANSKPALNGYSGYNIGSAKNQLTGSTSYNINNDFANTGKPTTSIIGAQGVLDDQADLRASIDWQGFEATYFFEWGAGNYNNSTTSKTYSSSGIVTETITGLQNNTTYQYRCVIYNGYNSNSADYIYSGQETFTTATPVDTSRPHNVVISQTSYSTPLATLVEWDSVSPGNPLEINYAVNGVSYNTYSLTAGTLSHSLSGYASGGDTVTVKVRYTSGYNTNWSPSATIQLFESA